MPRYIYGGSFTGDASGSDFYDRGSSFEDDGMLRYATDTPYLSCLIMEMDSDGDGVKDADAQDWYPVVFVINYPGYERAAVYYYRDGYSREATPILYYIDTAWAAPTSGNSTRQRHSSYDPGLPLLRTISSIDPPRTFTFIDEREEDYLYKKVRDLEIQMRGMQRRIDALEAAGQEEDGD